jgi:hypothetical protein
VSAGKPGALALDGPLRMAFPPRFDSGVMMSRTPTIAPGLLTWIIVIVVLLVLFGFITIRVSG